MFQFVYKQIYAGSIYTWRRVKFLSCWMHTIDPVPTKGVIYIPMQSFFRSVVLRSPLQHRYQSVAALFRESHQNQSEWRHIRQLELARNRVRTREVRHSFSSHLRGQNLVLRRQGQSRREQNECRVQRHVCRLGVYTNTNRRRELFFATFVHRGWRRSSTRGHCYRRLVDFLSQTVWML